MWHSTFRPLTFVLCMVSCIKNIEIKNILNQKKYIDLFGYDICTTNIHEHEKLPAS